MADAKTVKIKLDIDAQDAIKTSQDLKQQLNDMFKDDGNLGHSMDSLIEQMQVLTQHVDHVTTNLGDMFEMLKSVSNGTSSGINAQALQTQNTQYQEQLRLLTQMNSQMQLLLNQERQQRTASTRTGGGGTGERVADVEALRARLAELNAEYAHLEELSQECANQLSDLGQEGQAAMAAWAAEIANAGPELEDFNEIVENIRQQFADSGMPMSDATENVLRNWAAVANQMRNTGAESERVSNILNSQVTPAANNAGNALHRAGTMGANAFSTLSRGLRRASTIITSFGRLCNQLRGIVTRVFRLITSLGRGVVGVFSNLVSSTTSAGRAASAASFSFGALFKTVLATVLGIRGLSSVISSLKSIGTEGLKSIADSFAEIKTQLDSLEIAWTNFKASLVSIIQPIYSVIQPALTQLINWITNIMNTVAKFVAAFTGQSFIYKGVATAAKATGKAAKETTEDVKELVKQLQGFDELNNLTSQKEKEAKEPSGGGGGMFDNVKWEKEPIPDWIKDWVEKIKEILRQLFDPLKKAWERMGFWVMSSWKFALEEIWKLVKSIGKAFLESWGKGTVQKIFEDILFVVGAIGRAIGVLALKLREAWEENDRGVRFFDAIFAIIQKITEQLKFLAADTLYWLGRLDFNPLFEGVVVLLEDLVDPVEHLARIVRKFIVDVVYKYIKWLIEKGLPKILDNIDKLIQKLDWDKFENNITKLFEPLEHALEEISDGIIDFLDEMANKFVDWLNSDDFEKLTDDIAAFLNDINSEDIYNGLMSVKDAISGFFKQIKEDVEAIWNNEHVQRFITWLKGKDGDPEQLGRNIAKIVEALAGLFILGQIAGLLGPMLIVLSQASGLIGGLLSQFGLIAPAAAEAGSGAAAGLSGILSRSAGQSIGTTFAAGIIAGFAGMEVGKTLGAKIFPDDAALYEQYDGIKGSLNMLKDTAIAAKDAIVMADEKFEEWRDGGVETKIMNQNLSREIREGLIPTEDELRTRLEETGARYKIVEENMEDLRQKVLDANPDLQALKTGFEEAGIAVESLDSLEQVAVGLDTFNANGGDAAATIQTLSDTFGEADEFAQIFFTELSNGNDTFIQASESYTSYVDTMGNETDRLVDRVKTSLDTGLPTYEEMMGHGEKVTTGLSAGMEVGVTLISSTVAPELSTAVDGLIGELPTTEEMYQRGHDVTEGLSNGLKTGFGQIASFVVPGNAGLIITQLEDTFKIHSPSKVTEEMGINLVQGLINGWVETIPDFLTSITNFGTQFANAFVSVKNKVVDVFKSMYNAISGVLKNILSMISDAVKAASTSMQYMQNLNTSNISRRTTITTPRIPRLAQGAVIPPNKEFMAVLGDQRSGTNIETPLSTMVDAFNQAGGNRTEQELQLLQEQNQLLRQFLEKEWTISASQMLSAMQRQAVVFTKQSGKPAF